METLHVVTYNIHKGFSQFKRRMSVHDLRDKLRIIDVEQGLIGAGGDSVRKLQPDIDDFFFAVRFDEWS